MAQAGFTPLLTYSSSTALSAPGASDLINSVLGSELAINITDGKLFYKDNANAVQVIAWKVTPATAGGTGQTSYTTGDLLFASSSTALSKLEDVATGNALISGGVGAAPFYDKIGLTTHVSGTLAPLNGGTGITSLGTGVATWLGTPSSANLAAAVTDETGSGALVFGTAPTISDLTVTGTGGNVYSSTYTPTLTNSTNVAASTTGACQFMRVGNVVTVSGQISVDPTAAAVLTVLLISLPVASTFSSSRSAGGSAASVSNIYGEVGGILGNTASNVFELRLLPSSLANQSYAFQATYLIQ